MSKLNYLFNLLSLRTIPYVQPSLGLDEWKFAGSFLLGGDYSESPRKLEDAVRDLTGSTFALGVNRASSALQLALEAFQLPSDGEVILPSFSCNEIIDVVINAGLAPVLVDVDRDFNISAQSVRAALSAKTRCIIVPHLSGKFVEGMDEILSLAKSNDIKVIDDASQAFGLVVDGKWAGTFGDVGVYSFGFGKTLFGAGGGMLITSDKTVIEYMREYQFAPKPPQTPKKRLMKYMWWYGLQKISFPFSFVYKENMRRRYLQGKFVRPVAPFVPYHIGDMDASIAHSLMKKWEVIVSRQQKNAVRLIESGVFEKVGFRVPGVSDHNFTKLMITTERSQAETVEIKKHLRHAGIEIETGYTPLHHQKKYQSYRKVDMPETEGIWQGAFWLPMSPDLSSSQLLRIEKAILQASKQ